MFYNCANQFLFICQLKFTFRYISMCLKVIIKYGLNYELNYELNYGLNYGFSLLGIDHSLDQVTCSINMRKHFVAKWFLNPPVKTNLILRFAHEEVHAESTTPARAFRHLYFNLFPLRTRSPFFYGTFLRVLIAIPFWRNKSKSASTISTNIHTMQLYL